MLIPWYKKNIDRHLFRKLNFWISVFLFIIFILLGFITNRTFYNLLEEREQQLLDIHSQKSYDDIYQMIEKFKREVITLYVKDFTLQNQLTAGYQFLDAENMQINNIVVEREYFRNIFGSKINTFPEANHLLIYRTYDKQIFNFPKLNTMQFSPNRNLSEFFDKLPKDYHFPYIGTMDSSRPNVQPPFPYITSPIFHYNAINHDRVLGYFLLVLNPESLTQTFRNGTGDKSRLIVLQGSDIWLDTQMGEPIPSANNAHFLKKQLIMERYDLTVIGLKNLSAIQSKLLPIQELIAATLGFSLIICILLISRVQRRAVKRLQLLVKHFSKVKEDPFVKTMTVIGHDEISHLSHQFNDMTLNLQDHIRKEYIAELHKRNAEFYALKMQINPHFLYNTLESLRMQAVIKQQPLISEGLYRMGQLLRWLLKTSDDLIAIEEELQYAEYYLELCNMGKSNPIMLQVITHVDLTQCKMLKFSLQPILENAIIHGQLEKVSEPVIHLNLYQDDDVLCIEIFNNGSPLPLTEQIELQQRLEQPDVFAKEHFGLKNVQERMRAYYGSAYGLQCCMTEPEEKDGFRIIMKFPYRQTQVL